MRRILSKFKATTNTRMKSSEKASITIEAAIGLSIFMFAVLILLTPMISLKQQLHTAVILERHARELSKLKYLEYYGSRNEKLKLDSELLSSVETGVSLFWIGQDINQYGLKKMELLSETEIKEDQILLVANYELRIPFRFLTDARFEKQVVVNQRPWIGAKPYRFLEEGETEEEDILVYIGRDSVDVYHTEASCSYLVSKFLSGERTSMGEVRNRFGEKYAPCQSCHPGQSDTAVFFTEGGKRYHRSQSCPALQSHPHTETEQQALAEGRHRCHRCPALH